MVENVPSSLTVRLKKLQYDFLIEHHIILKIYIYNLSNA